jgi:hypothetical protein
VAPIEALGVRAAELGHRPGQVRLRRFDQQVVVVAHQDVPMRDQLPAVHDGRQVLQKALAILVVAVDRLAFAAPRHAVDGTGKPHPEGPRHPNPIVYSAPLELQRWAPLHSTPSVAIPDPLRCNGGALYKQRNCCY